MDERFSYRTDGLQPLTCAGRGGSVLVKKNSQAQTSIQWDAPAVAACVEFRAAGRNTALIAGCRTLGETKAAVLSGAVEVPDA